MNSWIIRVITFVLLFAHLKFFTYVSTFLFLELISLEYEIFIDIIFHCINKRYFKTAFLQVLPTVFKKRSVVSFAVGQGSTEGLKKFF